MQKSQVLPLGQEDPLVEEMATHSSIPAWKILIDRGAWRATVHGVAKSHTRLSNCVYMYTYLINSIQLYLLCNPLNENSFQ